MWILSFYDKFYNEYRIYYFTSKSVALDNYNWIKEKRNDITYLLLSKVVEHE